MYMQWSIAVFTCVCVYVCMPMHGNMINRHITKHIAQYLGSIKRVGRAHLYMIWKRPQQGSRDNERNRRSSSVYRLDAWMAVGLVTESDKSSRYWGRLKMPPSDFPPNVRLNHD